MWGCLGLFRLVTSNNLDIFTDVHTIYMSLFGFNYKLFEHETESICGGRFCSAPAKLSECPTSQQ